MNHKNEFLQIYSGVWENCYFHKLPSPEKELPKQGRFFHLWINSTIETPNMLGKGFFGKMEDRFGESLIEGTVYENRIFFGQRYSRKAVEKGAPKSSRKCVGQIVMTEREELIQGVYGGEGIESGVFVMKRVL